MGPASSQVRELLESAGIERASALIPRILPVAEPLAGLLPTGGLRRGTTVRLSGAGATSLALALVAEATREGWAAIAGMPWLGVAAAAELGVDLDRLVMVRDRAPSEVLAALVDAFDVVVTAGLGPRDARRLAARARERDAVLMMLSESTNARSRSRASPVVGRGEADLGLHVDSCTWHGIGRGHGHLAARTLTASSHGRGTASRQVTLRLPPENPPPNSTVERSAALTTRRAPQFRDAPLDPEPGSSTVERSAALTTRRAPQFRDAPLEGPRAG